jgi:ABC-type polysaccharide/polyol phosphate transport system ATPase subunit
MESRDSIITTRNLAKCYLRFAALFDCSLLIPQGEALGLLGPNGAGKTTLLRLLMGFLRPTSGSATIAGRDCWRESVAIHAGLAHLLATKGANQAELHRATGIPKSTISEVLAGKKPFSRQMICKLAAYFEVIVTVLAANL